MIITRRTVIFSGLSLVGILAVAVAVVTASKKANTQTSPGAATNFISFLDKRGEPERIRKLSSNGQDYLEFIAKIPNVAFHYPSGPPCYIFDERGQLIDWTPDRGDDPQFVAKWGSFSNATYIGIDDAKKFVRGQQSRQH